MLDAATYTPRLKAHYATVAKPALKEEFGYKNDMMIPRLEKIVVNIGLGEALTNAKAVEAAVGDLAIITGQKPITTKAKRSIAQSRSAREMTSVGATRMARSLGTTIREAAPPKSARVSPKQRAPARKTRSPMACCALGPTHSTRPTVS